MPLHLTKVAYGATNLDDMMGWFATRGEEARLTTRYLPKRHAEMIGGSLFWILKHQLVARSAILRFEDAENGRTHIVIDPKLHLVRPLPRRAHQGWRYLEERDAPPDLGGESEGDVMPGALAAELGKLGLL